jgi:hypothetical protein
LCNTSKGRELKRKARTLWKKMKVAQSIANDAEEESDVSDDARTEGVSQNRITRFEKVFLLNPEFGSPTIY